MTLNDLERRNGPYFAFFYGIRQIFRPIISQWLKIDPVKYCLPVPVFYFWRKLQRTLQRGLSAIAEHLVYFADQPPLL